jgi:hypothetical protein
MEPTTGERINQLNRQIEELKARLPKHSVPAAMIIELEEMEDELERLRTQAMQDQATYGRP